jgi:S1-C subfamily serine protease
MPVPMQIGPTMSTKTQRAIDEEFRNATLERLARYTLGIAVANNQGVGTGTLIASGQQRYLLTAAHVIRGAEPDSIRFWCRPPSPIIWKGARDATNSEMGRLTPGIPFPIVEITVDKDRDLALLRVDPTFRLPDGAEFYDLQKSREFQDWPVDKLEGLSVS